MIALDELRAKATSVAAQSGSAVVGAEHLFLAWLTLASGPAADALSAAGVTPESFRGLIDGGRRGLPATGGAAGDLSSHAGRAVADAQRLAAEAGRDTANADDVLLALTREPRGAIARALTTARVTPRQLRALIRPAEQRRDPASRAANPRAPQGPGPARLAVRMRDAETDDIPEARPPARPRIPVPSRPPAEAARRDSQRWLWLWLGLILVPVSLTMHVISANPVVGFVSSAAAIIPLAALLATATEQLANRTGPTVGALVNAAFGNATEVIVAIAAMSAGYLDLVKASIAGSILSNLLLVLGLLLVITGRRAPVVRFNRTAIGMGATMLALAVAALMLPSMLRGTGAVGHLTALSRMVAVILVCVYLASLWFSLGSHRDLLSPAHGSEHPVHWSMAMTLIVLAVATAAIAMESELLVDTIVPVTRDFGINQTFLGLIIVPIIGNAAEGATVLSAARRGRIDLGMQIALGSSTQVALLVAPLLVLVGAALGVAMNLVFPLFAVGAVGLAVVVTTFITLDGESHWLEGVQLIALYAMVAVAAWFI